MTAPYFWLGAEGVGMGLNPVARIQSVTAEHFGIPAADMKSSTRSRNVARPRQVAMFLARELTNQSLPEIGARFGHRDHTTVLHALRKVALLRESDEAFAMDLVALRERLAA